jgi:hypothetical protein
MKVLEHLHGIGVVTAENEGAVRAKYDIQITQDEPHPGACTPPVIAFKHVVGRIWSERDPYFVLSHARKSLLLQMEDGRKFRFFHRDLDGGIGLNEMDQVNRPFTSQQERLSR